MMSEEDNKIMFKKYDGINQNDEYELYNFNNDSKGENNSIIHNSDKNSQQFDENIFAEAESILNSLKNGDLNLSPDDEIKLRQDLEIILSKNPKHDNGDGKNKSKIKLGVMGSCISRDAFNSHFVPNYKDFFEIIVSAQRVSIISIMQDIFNINEDLIQIFPQSKVNLSRTNFIKCDFNKALIRQLLENDIEVLIMDNYFDVVMGVLYVNDNIITNNFNDLVDTQFYKNLKDKFVFNIIDYPEEYFSVWKEYCDLFFKFLNEYCPNTKVILNKGRLVYEMMDQNNNIHVIDAFKEESNQINLFLDKLDSYMEENFNVDVINHDFQNVYCDENHIWGLGPMNYSNNYYISLIDNILDIVNKNPRNDISFPSKNRELTSDFINETKKLNHKSKLFINDIKINSLNLTKDEDYSNFGDDVEDILQNNVGAESSDENGVDESDVEVILQNNVGAESSDEDGVDESDVEDIKIIEDVVDSKDDIGSTSVDEALSDLVDDYSNEIVIKVNNVSMDYKVSKDKIDTLKEFFIKTLKRNKHKNKTITALKNVSFEIPKGDRVGIIGFNGAGKSTLLKLLSKVYDPTEGTIETKGKIAPLLELGAGFDSNYTGKANIFLNGAFLGYTEDFIKEKYDEIVEFSELGDAINYHVKTYSSGMRAKLGFSIATIVEPDILIIDEILSVGDIKFQRKSSDKIRSLINSGITVLLVSHSVGQIRELCNKAIWVDNGEIKMMGEVNKVCDAYVKAANDATQDQLKNIDLD